MDPFIGEIRMFGASFAPQGWALCDGQTLAVSQYGALFRLIGTTYGGDGVTTFNLPDLRSRLPLHQGQGPGLSPRALGENGGAETVTLTSQQLAGHTHALSARSILGTAANPEGQVLAQTRNVDLYMDDVPVVPMATSAVSVQGNSQPHDNLMPFLCVNFIIALDGIYPTQG